MLLSIVTLTLDVLPSGRNSLLAEHFPHSVLKLLILNGVDEWIDDGIDTNHVHCETVELTCKTTPFINTSTKGSF